MPSQNSLLPCTTLSHHNHLPSTFFPACNASTITRVRPGGPTKFSTISRVPPKPISSTITFHLSRLKLHHPTPAVSLLSRRASTPHRPPNSPVRPLLVQHSVSTLLASDRIASSDRHLCAAVSADVGSGFVGRLVEGVAALTGGVKESWVAGDVGFVVGHDDAVGGVCSVFFVLDDYR